MHNTVPIPVQEAVLCVNGMKCAGCVQSVEKALGQMPGVVAASVNLVTAKATISYEPTQASVDELVIALTDLGFPTQVDAPVVQPPEADVAAPQPETLQRLRQIGVAAVLVLLSAIGHLHQVTGWHIPLLSDLWFHWALATVALLGPGRNMLIDGWQSLWRNMPNMNTLVSLGAVTAYLASDAALLLPQLGWECFFDAPVMIVGLVLLGRTLEEQARGRATAAFQALLNLQPASARQITDMAQQPWVVQTLPIRDVTEGMQLQVLPGDKFPVDGVVRSGQSTANEAMLTGESLPVPKGPGDRVMAGTLNQVNSVAIEATCTGEQTALADIIRCVEAAQARKAPIQRLADRVSGYFVYGVMSLAALTFCFWTAIGTHLWPGILHGADSMLAHHLDPSALPGDQAGLLLGLKLAISVLVVACPCALGLATPTAIVVGTSLGAEQGILIRGGDVLEAAHRLDTIAFDKTGTLTTGNPVVSHYWLSACAPDLVLESPAQLIQWAASLEAHSQHPFATAIEAKATELGLSRLAVADWYAHPGAGLTGMVEGQRLHLGNLSWLIAEGIEVDPGDRQQAEALTAQGQSVIFLAIQGRLAGGIALKDPLRADAAETIAALHRQNLNVILLTGDQQRTAATIGQQLGLAPADIYAEVSPLAKAEIIQTLQSQGRRVGMVGDGINDAPALVQANVGIALSSGTDAAIEAAQIVLMHSRFTEAARLKAVSGALKLSQATFRTIQQNLGWALGYNLVGIPLAAGFLLPQFGLLLGPAAAAALMAFSSVSVVANALMLRRIALD